MEISDRPGPMRPGWPAPPEPGASFEDLQQYAQTMLVAEFFMAGEEADGLPAPYGLTAQQAWEMAESSRCELERMAAAKAEAAPVSRLPIDEAFNAAKELCRSGHPEVDDIGGCTYGGMSSAHGYWLADENCLLSHGETCDLRIACDGAEATTGFRGSEPDPDIWYWVWAVSACQSCADLYVAAHPEWSRESVGVADA